MITEERVAIIIMIKEEKVAINIMITEERVAIIIMIKEKKVAIIIMITEERVAIIIMIKEEKVAIIITLTTIHPDTMKKVQVAKTIQGKFRTITIGIIT